MSLPTLYCIAYSPWSIKARWAADYNQVAYRKAEFLPMVSNARLRVATGRLGGRITVPCWIDADQVLMDSFDIARHVDRGRGLFPSAHEAAIRSWNDHSEAALAAGRALTTASVARDPAALRASLPGPLRSLGPVSQAIGLYGVRYLRRKYGFGASELAGHERTLRDTLEHLRAALERGNGDHLCGDSLSYADITMAVGLCFVRPPAGHPLPDEARHHWTRDFASEYDDLLSWRDRIYQARPSRR